MQENQENQCISSKAGTLPGSSHQNGKAAALLLTVHAATDLQQLPLLMPDGLCPQNNKTKGSCRFAGVLPAGISMQRKCCQSSRVCDTHLALVEVLLQSPLVQLAKKLQCCMPPAATDCPGQQQCQWLLLCQQRLWCLQVAQKVVEGSWLGCCHCLQKGCLLGCCCCCCCAHVLCWEVGQGVLQSPPAQCPSGMGLSSHCFRFAAEGSGWKPPDVDSCPHDAADAGCHRSALLQEPQQGAHGWLELMTMTLAMFVIAVRRRCCCCPRRPLLQSL